MRDTAYKKVKTKRDIGEKASWYHLRCFRKTLFDMVGGFNIEMRFFEDVDLAKRALAYSKTSKSRIHKANDLEINHYHFFFKCFFSLIYKNKILLIFIWKKLILN